MTNFFAKQRADGRGYFKLDADKVRRIRARLAAGMTQREVAKEFGIGKTTVCNISTRSTWGQVV